MKRYLIVAALVLLCASSAIAFPATWVNDARLYEMGENTYRLRFVVEWDVSIVSPEPPQVRSDWYPVLAGVNLTGSQDAFNFYFPSIDARTSFDGTNSEIWLGEYQVASGVELGFDFTTDAPISSMAFDYTAFYGWQLDGYLGDVSLVSNTGAIAVVGDNLSDIPHADGSFLAHVVPEPAAVALFGLGLLALGVVRRVRHR